MNAPMTRRAHLAALMAAAAVGATIASARAAAAANPSSWKRRPRRVYVSGNISGAASCTVTTSGARARGGTATDGACTTSTSSNAAARPSASGSARSHRFHSS